jgi:hypothetical protein
MPNPFLRGPYAFGSTNPEPPPDDALIGSIAHIADGAVSVLYPSWQELTISSLNSVGSGATLADNAITFIEDGDLFCEFRCNILHSYGSYVIFGVQWGTQGIINLGQVQINSNTPIFVLYDKKIQRQTGVPLKFYVSSNFQWEDFEWSAMSITGLIPNAN